ncbi:rCG22806 [Rattus norvegicus]|uniref:RCG22806 n=1 Tax=Rattus norvegicus TaxID=10116 RepID=A6JYF8_RAT|nr:rCG22806 [Rattus norvegicus]
MTTGTELVTWGLAQLESRTAIGEHGNMQLHSHALLSGSLFGLSCLPDASPPRIIMLCLAG